MGSVREAGIGFDGIGFGAGEVFLRTGVQRQKKLEQIINKRKKTQPTAGYSAASTNLL